MTGGWSHKYFSCNISLCFMGFMHDNYGCTCMYQFILILLCSQIFQVLVQCCNPVCTTHVFRGALQGLQTLFWCSVFQREELPKLYSTYVGCTRDGIHVLRLTKMMPLATKPFSKPPICIKTHEI